MPYYAYVNGKATIGLGTVDELKDYILKTHGDFLRNKVSLDVEIYDMTWTPAGQEMVESYKVEARKLS